MNETRTFLLRMMGEAQSLEEFWHAYRALQNLTRLVFLAQQTQQAPPITGVRYPQQGSGQGPTRFQQPPEDLHAQGEEWERMPWEGGE